MDLCIYALKISMSNPKIKLTSMCIWYGWIIHCVALCVSVPSFFFDFWFICLFAVFCLVQLTWAIEPDNDIHYFPFQRDWTSGDALSRHNTNLIASDISLSLARSPVSISMAFKFNLAHVDPLNLKNQMKRQIILSNNVPHFQALTPFLQFDL